jgi:hypothetical protein
LALFLGGFCGGRKNTLSYSFAKKGIRLAPAVLAQCMTLSVTMFVEELEWTGPRFGGSPSISVFTFSGRSLSERMWTC